MSAEAEIDETTEFEECNVIDRVHIVCCEALDEEYTIAFCGKPLGPKKPLRGNPECRKCALLMRTDYCPMTIDEICPFV